MHSYTCMSQQIITRPHPVLALVLSLTHYRSLSLYTHTLSHYLRSAALAAPILIANARATQLSIQTAVVVSDPTMTQCFGDASPVAQTFAWTQLLPGGPLCLFSVDRLCFIFIFAFLTVFNLPDFVYFFKLVLLLVSSFEEPCVR